MLPRHFAAALLAALVPLSCAPAGAATLKAAAGGTVHALVIGINEYPRLVGHSLRGARQDAEDIAAALARDGVTDLTLVRDQEATRAKIVSEIDRLVTTSQPGDLVILTYAGHGMQTPEYPRWHGIDHNGVNEQIALSGFDFTGPGAGEVIVNEEVRAWLSRLDAKGVDTLVAWDSCFGGGMRSVAAGGDEIRVRQVQGSPEEEERKKFVAISMTEKEARADVKAMSHVTFLSGATARSVVPEMTGVDPHNRTTARGALSYFLARAFDGEAKPTGGVSRSELFPFLKQGVREATAGRQAIQVDPQSDDPAVSDRTIFVLGDGKDVAPKPAPAVGACSSSDPSAKPDTVEPVCVAVINGPADAFKSIEKGAVPLVVVAEPAAAELVWNVSAKLAIAQSDTLMENVDGSLIGAIADRVRTLTLLRTIGQGRPLLVSLETGGALLKDGQTTKIDVDDLRGEHLTVFDITADATVQMIYPPPPDAIGPCRDPMGNSWLCSVGVTPPFGVDTLVAIASSREPAAIKEWLAQHQGRRDAAGVPALVQALLTQDAAARIGFVPVVTHANDN